MLHGLHYGQQSRKLYAVNHDEEAGESVEVFNAVGDGAELKLVHSLSVTSPLFGNMALNDVVEGATEEAEGEFYVTEWQPFPFPAGGKAGMSTASLGLRIQRNLLVPMGDRRGIRTPSLPIWSQVPSTT